jgi:hypothetical protein
MKNRTVLITDDGATTISIMTLSITTLSIMTLSIRRLVTTFSINDTYLRHSA